MRGIYSIGMTLTDALDDLIQENRMDPQLAMKIVANFDRAIAETLQEKVKSRLTFRVITSFVLPGRLAGDTTTQAQPSRAKTLD